MSINNANDGENSVSPYNTVAGDYLSETALTPVIIFLTSSKVILLLGILM